MTRYKILVTTFLFFILSGFLTGSYAANKQDNPSNIPHRVYAGHSVLSSGAWYKIAVAKSGVCKLTYADLQAMGLSIDQINPQDIRIYGNGGGMLPEYNAVKRFDDLQENAIEVVGESDGRFDAGDLVLFYAKGPVNWRYNSSQKLWESYQDPYSDSAYYFLTTSLGKGKRISSVANETATPTDIVTTYDYRTFHEKDAVNLIKSGRSWYGEIFDITNSYTFTFDIPNLVPGSEIHLKTSTAARSTSNSYFSCNSGTTSWNIVHSPISTYYNSPYASGSTDYRKITVQSTPVEIKMQYNRATSTALGWLDAINLTAKCNLNFKGGQFDFRDTSSVGDGRIARFKVSDAATKAAIWEITDPLNCKKVISQQQGNELDFTLHTDSLREFVVFDNNDLITPRFVSRINNQDLHGISSADLVIISPAIFYDQALRLATYHNTVDDLNSIVVSPELIYNEYSSGAPDVIAIRDFMKMLYDRGGSTSKPKYLLLFGDGSYDNKDRLPNNTNFIPTWQSSESFDPVRSEVSDDAFGLLDDTEGLYYSDPVDIGIGRLPVKTVAEAQAMVDKIIHYSEKAAEVMGDWRNIIGFIADDEDGNEHVHDADMMAGFIHDHYGNFNVDKIYLDAYTQVATPSGARYPDVNAAITQRVEKGCLILNYTGHGGETGWAHEQVLEVQDINGWTNYSKLPVFVTATCEFSRFDDPARTSAGELVFLNERGGGVALFSTTRPTYGTPNYELNTSFYKYALNHSGTSKPRMGDIIMDAKRESGSDENGRKFILLGDPAQQIAYPSLNIATDTINGKVPGVEPDTLMAYQEVTIAGSITDETGAVVSDFNGVVVPTVFDKAVVQNTLGNDGGTPFQFSLQKNILYRGKVAAQNGRFRFTFIVPKDIAYREDFGKISYYATNDTVDAAGNYTNVIVGGSSSTAKTDNTGPDISLYMNDLQFTDGSITDENPWLLARVSDENGINTIGSGIGHDITAILDGKTDAPSILNDFYESDINTFRSGLIRFPYSRLSSGEHTITVKVWDIYDNSSEATIHFIVHSSDNFVMEKGRNYPNPFRDGTNIVFDHNQQGDEMKVDVTIYTMMGEKVCVLENTSLQEGTVSNPVYWDGRNSKGSQVESGIYYYNIQAKTASGSEARCSGKLIYTK
ncbi:MAG: type IX secretion system sortase PorU [Bacteroidetes bacterium]|nr:type IX secretion system sortase PorU [Bacteroidota bacterium]